MQLEIRSRHGPLATLKISSRWLSCGNAGSAAFLPLGADLSGGPWTTRLRLAGLPRTPRRAAGRYRIDIVVGLGAQLS